MTEFAKIIKTTRQKRKLTQAQVAEALGYSTVGMINKVEKGASGVSAARIKQWAKVLRLPVKTLANAKVEDYKIKIYSQIRAK